MLPSRATRATPTKTKQESRRKIASSFVVCKMSFELSWWSTLNPRWMDMLVWEMSEENGFSSHEGSFQEPRLSLNAEKGLLKAAG